MADPTNPNDPTYKNDPKYVFSGGRWQYRGTGDSNTPPPPERVTGEGLGTPGGLSANLTSTTAATIPGFAELTKLAQENAVRQQATNPYSAAIADQSRAAQLALLGQMRAQAAGPSIAGMQGQGAMGQGLQAALRAGGGRVGMVGLGQQSAGMAGDVARARLAEAMRAQAGMGGLAGGLRGADLRSAQEQTQAGFQAQNIADQRARAYAQMGANLGLAKDRLDLEQWKFYQRLLAEGKKANEAAATLGVKALGTAAGAGI